MELGVEKLQDSAGNYLASKRQPSDKLEHLKHNKTVTLYISTEFMFSISNVCMKMLLVWTELLHAKERERERERNQSQSQGKTSV